MPLVLVETAGATDANTFGTLAEADLYFAAHLYPGAWATAATEVKKAALIHAARLLNVLAGRDAQWTGVAASSSQALAWPRSGMLSRNGYEIASEGAASIPVDLKASQFEIARALLASDTTADSAIETLGLTHLKAGPIALTFSDSTEVDGVSHALPDSAWDLLVPSWYEAAEIEQDFMFETM